MDSNWQLPKQIVMPPKSEYPPSIPTHANWGGGSTDERVGRVSWGAVGHERHLTHKMGS